METTLFAFGSWISVTVLSIVLTAPVTIGIVWLMDKFKMKHLDVWAILVVFFVFCFFFVKLSGN